jgi:hypothetical protein
VCSVDPNPRFDFLLSSRQIEHGEWCPRMKMMNLYILEFIVLLEQWIDLTHKAC